MSQVAKNYPTRMQKEAVNHLVAHGGSLGAAMRAVGYSPETARSPQKLTESKGFKELCEEAGLTDELLLNALVNDINAKPANRVQELTLAAKLRGRLSEQSNGGTTNNIIVFGDGQSELIARRLLARRESSEKESGGLLNSN